MASSREGAHPDQARPNSAETVFNQRDILGEPGELSPAFAVDYLSCASKKQRTVENEKNRGIWTADLSHIYRIKPEWGKKRVFFPPPHPKEKRWIYSCGFVDVYWLFSRLQQSKQRKEVSLTLLLPAQITLSRGGVKWKSARFSETIS